METMLCAVAFALILFYFSNSFSSLEQDTSEIDTDSLIYSLINTREVNISSIPNIKTSSERIMGTSFELKMFFINSSCYILNSTDSLIQNSNCSYSFNTNKNVFSGEAKISTGETIKILFWRKM